MAPRLKDLEEAGVSDPEALASVLSDSELMSLMDEAQSAPEPGAAQFGYGADGKPIKDARSVIFRGDDEVPAPILAAALKSAGHAYVWDKRTGERSVVSRNNLGQMLKKRDEETGLTVFTGRKPGVQPVRGTIPCILHKDRRTPDMAAMGLPTCRKANLTSEYEARLHAQHRHKSAWAAIEETKRLEREDEERQSRKALVAIMQAQQAASGKG